MWLSSLKGDGILFQMATGGKNACGNKSLSDKTRRSYNMTNKTHKCITIACMLFHFEVKCHRSKSVLPLWKPPSVKSRFHCRRHRWMKTHCCFSGSDSVSLPFRHTNRWRERCEFSSAQAFSAASFLGLSLSVCWQFVGSSGQTGNLINFAEKPRCHERNCSAGTHLWSDMPILKLFFFWWILLFHAYLQNNMSQRTASNQFRNFHFWTVISAKKQDIFFYIYSISYPNYAVLLHLIVGFTITYSTYTLDIIILD